MNSMATSKYVMNSMATRMLQLCLVALILAIAHASSSEEGGNVSPEQAALPKKRRRGLSIVSNLLDDMGLNEVSVFEWGIT